MIRSGCIWITGSCDGETPGQSRCKGPEKYRDRSRLNGFWSDKLGIRVSKGDAHLIGIKDKGSNVSMAFAFDIADSFRCRDASDNDVTLLLEFDDQREAKRVIPAQYNLEGLGNVKVNQTSRSTHR